MNLINTALAWLIILGGAFGSGIAFIRWYDERKQQRIEEATQRRREAMARIRRALDESGFKYTNIGKEN